MEEIYGRLLEDYFWGLLYSKKGHMVAKDLLENTLPERVRERVVIFFLELVDTTVFDPGSIL